MTQTGKPEPPIPDLASKRHARNSHQPRPDPPDPAKLTKSQAARRDRIIETAHTLLQHHRYDEIQMRDVADHAGVAIGTVYRYFISKEHLFALALLRWASGLEARIETAPLRGETVEERLLDVYGRVIDAFGRSPQFFQLMMVLENTSDPLAQETYNAFNENAANSLSAPFHQLDEHVSRQIAAVLMAVLIFVLRAWASDTMTIEDCHRSMQEAVSLIFSPSPELRPTDA